MDEVRLTIGSGGRISLPARQRKVLGLAEGDEVLVGIEDGAFRVESRDAAIERVQRKVRERFGSLLTGRNLSEELIAERREEARRENAEFNGDPEDASVEVD